MRLQSFRAPRTLRRSRRVLVGVAIAGLVFVLAEQSLIGSTLFGGMLLCLLLLETGQLRAAMIEGQRQQYALMQIRPLLGDLPLELGGWAADAVILEHAVRLIMESRPRLVLECGSGSSTVVIARALRILGGRIISLEDDPVYARRTAEMLGLADLNGLATVVTAPIVLRDIGGHSAPWYAPAYEPLLNGPIDVMLVDGPQKTIGPRARYPAVPLLKSQLAAECWILMDDGDRPDERAIAHAWSEELGAKLTYLQGGRGGWLLHRRPAASVQPGHA